MKLISNLKVHLVAVMVEIPGSLSVAVCRVLLNFCGTIEMLTPSIVLTKCTTSHLCDMLFIDCHFLID